MTHLEAFTVIVTRTIAIFPDDFAEPTFSKIRLDIEKGIQS